MKTTQYIIALLTITLLASCGTNEIQVEDKNAGKVQEEQIQEVIEPIEPAEEAVLDEIDTAIDEIIEEEEIDSAAKAKELLQEKYKKNKEVESVEENPEDIQEEVSSVGLIQLEQTYTSPAGTETVSFQLDINDGVIENVGIIPVWVENPVSTARIDAFANEINTVIIGKTLEEAKNIGVVGGSSLTTEAFITALKNM